VRLSPQRWLILGAIATVAVMVIIYMSVISPARTRESNASAQLATEQTAIAADRQQVAQLETLAANQPAELAKAFRLAQAIPLGPQTPGMILELQALAKASDVTLSQVRTISTTPVNNVTATAYEVDVVGRFFNVDDFIYRVHHQVNVSSSGSVAIKGRLFAVTGVQMTLAGSSGTTTSVRNGVLATLQLMTFSTSGSTGGPSTSSGTAPTSGTSGSGSSGTSTSPGTTTTPAKSGGLG
jgi:Tfp pilus assembly protein PilO